MILRLNSDRGGNIAATFRTEGAHPMIMELVIRFGQPGESCNDVRSEILRLIDDMRYCASGAGDCSECNLQQVKTLARRCREAARLRSENVTTGIHLWVRGGLGSSGPSIESLNDTLSLSRLGH